MKITIYSKYVIVMFILPEILDEGSSDEEEGGESGSDSDSEDSDAEGR